MATSTLGKAVLSQASPNIWVLTDDRAGNRSQALGVTSVLDFPYTEKSLAYGAIAGLPNQILGASLRGLNAESREMIAPPWPDLVIAAGRRLAPVARSIRASSGNHTRLVQIMNPGGNLDDFALIAVPSHDPPVDGANILNVTGAPHGLTPATLAEARDTWKGELGALPAPRIAAIVGGSTRRRQFTAEMAATLGRRVSAIANAAEGSLMVTTSRRTADSAGALINALDGSRRVHQWGDAGDNPYLGYLAFADVIVVTGESISMCSEACATGVPVFIFAPPGLITDKHQRFHDILFAAGLAYPLDEDRIDLDSAGHTPLNAANPITDAIRNILAELAPNP